MIGKKKEYSLTDTSNPEKSYQLSVYGQSTGVPLADLPLVDLPPANLLPADLPPADLSPADMPKADLPPADWPPADLPPANLPKADLPPADLPPADLPPAYDIVAHYDNPAFLGNSLENCQQSVDIPAEQQKPYNPHDFGNTHRPTSFWDTVFHLVIIIAGPSVLSIPITFVGAGYVTALILLPILFCLYMHNVDMVIWCEYQLCKVKRKPTLSYPEVAYHAFRDGPTFSRWFAKCSQLLVYLDFLLIWFGFYCYNYVIVCQNLQVFIANIFHLHVSMTTLLQMLLIPLLLLACIPKLKYLVPFSFMGSVFNAISLVLIVYFVIVDPGPWRIPSTFGEWTNAPMFVGAVLANLNIMGIMIPLKNEMKEPRKFGSGCGAVTVAYLSTTIVYSAFSLICALKYGDRIQPSVIENLPETNQIAQIGIGVSSLSIICQQPLVLHVPFDLIWNQVLKNTIQSQHSTVWEYLFRLFLVFFTFGISLVVPNVFVFISISGTIGTSIDSLILPALINTAVQRKITKNQLKFWLIFGKNMVIVVLGVALVVFGGIDSVKGILEYYAIDKSQ